jgi:hypothetical protein
MEPEQLPSQKVEDILKWVEKRIVEYKSLRRQYLQIKDNFLSEENYDPDASEHFKTLSDISLGRILILEQIKDKLTISNGEQ